jgi:hypothetical protein
MAEPARAVATYRVRLHLPPGMSPEQGLREMCRGIAFGQPEVTLVENPDEQES